MAEVLVSIRLLSYLGQSWVSVIMNKICSVLFVYIVYIGNCYAEEEQVISPRVEASLTEENQADNLTIDKGNIDSLATVDVREKKTPSDSEELNALLIEEMVVQKQVVAQLLEITENQRHELEDLKSRHLTTSSGIDFASWAGILLASVAVLVTVLGVVIALISFWGYKNFKQSTTEAAEKVSNEVAARVAKDEAEKSINEVAKQEIARMIDEGELTEHLESAVDIIFRNSQLANGVGGFNKYPEIDEEDDK